MSKARDEYLEYEITNGLNPKIHNYVCELEDLLKECIIDKDILKYNNMELEQQKAELIDVLEKIKSLCNSKAVNNHSDQIFLVTDIVLNKYKEGEGGREMSACEKCWGDAFVMSIHSGYSQAECYNQLLNERRNYPCTPQEQAGQFWDEENQCDRRLL